VDRRSVLTLMGVVVLAACSRRDRSDPSQFGELTRPAGASRGVVVVIHGGFWRGQYDLSLGRPLVPSLVDAGWAVYNIEYRRVGNGGGWPQTFDDVAAAIDALADEDDLDLSSVVTLGHSAGGSRCGRQAGPRSRGPRGPLRRCP
jgi:acetyl esterase/lipase